jgi:hypothetical protein
VRGGRASGREGRGRRLEVGHAQAKGGERGAELGGVEAAGAVGVEVLAGEEE